MAIKAKFRCVEKMSRSSASPYDANPSAVGSEHVVLQALTGEENKEWSKWTPSGRLEMEINNPAAVEQLQVGKDYYLEISPA